MPAVHNRHGLNHARIFTQQCCSVPFRGNNPYAGKEERRVGLGPNLGVYDYVRDGYSIPRVTRHL